MTKKFHFENILINKIDPFSYQKRKYFDEDKLKELAKSIKNEIKAQKNPGLVSQMQKKRTLGVVRRTLIIARKR
jgi:hypothetical protein